MNKLNFRFISASHEANTSQARGAREWAGRHLVPRMGWEGRETAVLAESVATQRVAATNRR